MPDPVKKTVQLDETEYQAQLGVIQTVNQMLANPEARKLVLQARKIADPKAVVPEIDAAAPVLKVIEEQNKKLEELQTAIAKDKEEREAEAKKAAITNKFESGRQLARDAGYMDEGLKKLEEFMEKRGIFDHEVAIPAFEALHPAPPTPATPGVSGAFEFFAPEPGDSDDIKKMMESRGEDPAALNNLINKGLADARGSGRI